MAVKNIATQGRPVASHRQWVKSYEISTSVGGTEWAKSGAYGHRLLAKYMDNNAVKVSFLIFTESWNSFIIAL